MKGRYLFITAFLAQLVSNAHANTEKSDDWVELQHISSETATYETSLIRTDGYFNIDVTVWLRATHEINQDECGPKPQEASNNYSGGALFTPEIIANRNHSICIKSLTQKNKTAIYKILIECSKKELTVIHSSAANYLGEPVQNNIPISSHPGSVGHSVMQRYCKM